MTELSQECKAGLTSHLVRVVRVKLVRLVRILVVRLVRLIESLWFMVNVQNGFLSKVAFSQATREGEELPRHLKRVKTPLDIVVYSKMVFRPCVLGAAALPNT